MQPTDFIRKCREILTENLINIGVRAQLNEEMDTIFTFQRLVNGRLPSDAQPLSTIETLFNGKSLLLKIVTCFIKFNLDPTLERRRICLTTNARTDCP